MSECNGNRKPETARISKRIGAMNQLTLVAETRLLQSQNEELYDYFGDYSQLFCFLVRRTIHHLRHGLHGEKNLSIEHD